MSTDEILDSSSSSHGQGARIEMAQKDSNSMPPPTTDSIASRTENVSSKKRKAPKTRSKIWIHYDRIKKKGVDDAIDDEVEVFERAKCKYCGNEYKCQSNVNGTSALWKHFRVCKQKPPEASTQTQISFSVNADGDGTLSSWKFNQTNARTCLAKFIMRGELPFDIVDLPEFKEFCQSLNPKFMAPLRKTNRRDIVGVYDAEKVKLKTYFKNTSCGIYLTADTWTTNRGTNYMSITAHYIDDGWHLRKKILNFVEITSHKGDDMGRTIDKYLKEWGVSKIMTCTVDNASTNDKLVNHLNGRFSTCLGGAYMQMRCVAHIINLIVCDGLKESNVSIVRVREAIKYVRSSGYRRLKFKDCVESEAIACKKSLCLDVCTRWNSTFLMLDIAENFELAFKMLEEVEPQFKIDLEAHGCGVPTAEDWRIVRRMVAFLRHFYDLTNKVSGTSYVTSSNFFHELTIFYGVLNHWKRGNELDMRVMAEQMLLKCDKYWGAMSDKMNLLLFVAVVLDPRYKFKYVDVAIREMYCGYLGETVVAKVKDVCYKMFEEYNIKYSHLNQGAGQSSSDPSPINLQELTPQEIVRAKYQQLYEEVGGGASISELDKYLSEGFEGGIGDERYDILKWWRNNSARFPILSIMCRDLLAIPISTVASESIFSTSGRVLNSFRSSLSPKIAEALICASDWVKPSIDAYFDNEEDLEEQEAFEEELSKKN